MVRAHEALCWCWRQPRSVPVTGSSGTSNNNKNNNENKNNNKNNKNNNNTNKHNNNTGSSGTPRKTVASRRPTVRGSYGMPDVQSRHVLHRGALKLEVCLEGQLNFLRPKDAVPRLRFATGRGNAPTDRWVVETVRRSDFEVTTARNAAERLTELATVDRSRPETPPAGSGLSFRAPLVVGRFQGLAWMRVDGGSGGGGASRPQPGLAGSHWAETKRK
ncbi:unnamed protein product [Polarella glacialis]|nr:unnamed protein product [Polarella glacialis]